MLQPQLDSSSLGWPRRSNAYDSGAAAVAYWLVSIPSAEWMRPEMTWGRTFKRTLKFKVLPVNFKEGMAYHSRG
jgi:hypothetical protein